MTFSPPEKELLDLTTRLLEAIVGADWTTYSKLCDPSITCFEPEARGHLVEGMPFHEFYFRLGGPTKNHCTTMSRPHVRVIGDAAVVSYVRLNQRMNAAGDPVTYAVEETRIWEKKNGEWKHVHFHRSVGT